MWRCSPRISSRPRTPCSRVWRYKTGKWWRVWVEGVMIVIPTSYQSSEVQVTEKDWPSTATISLGVTLEILNPQTVTNNCQNNIKLENNNISWPCWSLQIKRLFVIRALYTCQWSDLWDWVFRNCSIMLWTSLTYSIDKVEFSQYWILCWRFLSWLAFIKNWKKGSSMQVQLTWTILVLKFIYLIKSYK